MLKKSINLIILILSGNILFAQYTFEQMISRPDNLTISHVIEDDESNFVFVGRMHHINTNYAGGYIIKIDSQANTVNTELLKPGMYFYRLINEKNKTIETGKWIKK